MRRGLALALALAALLATSQPAHAAFVVKSVYDDSAPYDYRFKPATANVARGTKVTWKSMAGLHTVTAVSNNWSKDAIFTVGSPTSFTFNKAGTYRYRCTYHSSYNASTKRCTGQCGKVIVT